MQSMPESPRQLQVVHVQNTLRYLRARMNAGCESGSKKHNDLAKRTQQYILKGLCLCATLEATAATSMIELFKTELFAKEERDLWVKAINSKAKSNFAHIDDNECDCNQKCDTFNLYLTDSDIFPCCGYIPARSYSSLGWANACPKTDPLQRRDLCEDCGSCDFGMQNQLG